MKLLSIVLLLLLSLADLCAGPYLVVSSRNFDDMIAASMKFAEAFKPGSGKEVREQFLEETGNTNLIGVDRLRPWHHATFNGANSRTWHVHYVPVKDFQAFTKSLQDGKQFKGFQNLNVIRHAEEYAVIVRRFNKRSPLSQSDEDRIVDWAKSAPRVVKSDFVVRFELDEQMRGMAVFGMGMARAALLEQMKPAVNGRQRAPTALLLPGAFEMLTVFVDVATIIVRGTERVTVTLDVQDDRLLLRDRVEARAGSEFAQLLQPNQTDLGPLLKRFDDDTPIAFAMHIAANSHLRKLFLRAAHTSGKMTGNRLPADFVKQSEALLDGMLPLSLAAAFDWRKNYQAAGVYRVANTNASAIQGRLLAYLESYLTAQANAQGIYSGVQVQRQVRRAEGLPVDTMKIKLNPKSPAFANEIYRAIQQRIWPQNEMTAEFAARGRELFYATGLPVEQVLSAASNRRPILKPDGNSVMLGRINLIELLMQTMADQPRISTRDLQLLAELDSDGAAIDGKVNFDGGIAATVSIPLRFVREMGKVINGVKPPSKKP